MTRCPYTLNKIRNGKELMNLSGKDALNSLLSGNRRVFVRDKDGDVSLYVEIGRKGQDDECMLW